MQYFSMFTGIGGFELGIQNAYRATLGRSETDTSRVNEKGQGLLTKTGKSISSKKRRTSSSSTNGIDDGPLCIGYSEIDKYAIKTFEEHYEYKNYGDATTIIPSGLPDFELLVGGFPCQSFSMAGKRAGFEDTRGTLFFDVARILADKRPRHLVLENVKGLLSHDGGKTFTTIIRVLTDMGYDIEWQLLNSKDFGVPQNRERVYIIGHLRDECRRHVLPISRQSNKNTTIGKSAKTTVARTLTGGGHSGGNHSGMTIVKEDYMIHNIYGGFGETKPRIFKGISPTIRTGGGGGHLPMVVAQRGRYKEDGKTEQRLEHRHDGVTSTLTSVQKDNMLLESSRIRRLTPIECERLQGFPDNWTVGSNTQRYKQFGNAVTVNVVTAVMSALKECLA
jgi:DNA (cytosine-5)-methyltransferase 1